MATIKDVAREAKVACSTVSHVFNGSAPISEATKRSVLEAAEKLGYVPRVRRNPRRHAPRKIIIFKRVGRGKDSELDPMSEDFADPIVAAAYRCLKAHGFGVWVLPHSEDDLGDCIYSVNLSEFAGAIVVDNVVETFSSFPGLPMPTVLAYCEAEVKPYLSVVPDDFRGAYEATRHLIALGHKRVAFINGPESWFASRARLQGYLASLDEFGIAKDEDLIRHAGWAVEDGRAAATELLGDSDVSAVFAANDLLAVGVIHAAQERGLRVPTDLAVVGFDNRLLAQVVEPQLTTVHLPLTGIGERAALEIMHRLTARSVDRKAEVSKILVHCPLVIRDSCGYKAAQ